jgi:hypothetical protein
MNRLTPRERRLLALGLLVLVLAAAWVLVAQPLLAGFAARNEQRRQLVADYAHDQRLIDAIPAWRAQSERQKQSARSFELAAPSQVQAQEMLKQRLTSTLTAQGAAAPTVQDATADLPAGWVGARADAQLTLAQFVAGIRQIESDTPYVVVEYVSINADQAFQTGHAGPLEVRLEVSAPFRLAAGPP